MLAAIPYDKTSYVHFGIDAIAIDESHNNKDTKRIVNRHLISCFRQCEMPGSMWEDELVRYGYYLVPWELYEKINKAIEICVPLSIQTVVEVNCLISSLYQSLDVRAPIELSKAE